MPKPREPRTEVAATRQTMTVMFIDVAGFSLAAEGRDPATIFPEIRDRLVKMRHLVHAHGGIVDKVLGDGLLCYFGYRTSDAEPEVDHATQALLASIALQQDALSHCMEAQKHGRPMYPIRIGLNTAPVIVGDVGDDRRREMTVIGEGVNYAKRIEDACDVFMIMLSESTRAALAPSTHAGLLKRSISVKHHDRLFDVYEFNPFVDRNDELMKARRLFQQFQGVYRGEERLAFSDQAPFDAQSDYGDCTIVDVSPGGFQVRLHRYLARGVYVKLAINARQEGNRRAQYLNLIGLTAVVCMVRWGRPAADGGV
jgi:class 3 adenylate cyclase